MDFDSSIEYRFFRLNEISESKAKESRLAMANVLSSLVDPESHSPIRIIYLLAGKEDGISLYLGVAGQFSADHYENLEAAFIGNFPGAKTNTISANDPLFSQMFTQSKHLGLITGVPSFNEEDQDAEDDFQGVERLINTLSSDKDWQIVIVAEPSCESEIRHSLDEIYSLSTQLSALTKYSEQKSQNWGSNQSKTKGTSETQTDSTTQTKGTNRGSNKSVTKGTNTSRGSSEGDGYDSTNSSNGTSNSKTEGTNEGENESLAKGISNAKGVNQSVTAGQNSGESLTYTREHIDKDREQTLQHLNETQIDRFRQGLSKGMFCTAVYISASKKNTYHRLARGILSVYQGSQSVVVPLNVQNLQWQEGDRLNQLLQIHRYQAENYLQNNHPILFNIPHQDKRIIKGATWLTAKELSLLVGLPNREVSGLKLRKSVSFAVNTEQSQSDSINLGNIVQDGRTLKNKHILIPRNALDKHIFVTGVTGAGKTTTCMNLLLESGYPFVVIEPAKTEYRALHGQGKEISILLTWS